MGRAVVLMERGFFDVVSIAWSRSWSWPWSGGPWSDVFEEGMIRVDFEDEFWSGGRPVEVIN